MARKAAGEEPLPEEDPSNPVFKPLPEPSRLESFLITNQISNYCNQINGYVMMTVLLFFHVWGANIRSYRFEVSDFILFLVIVFSSRLSLIFHTFCCMFCRVSGQSFNRLYLMKALHEDWKRNFCLPFLWFSPISFPYSTETFLVNLAVN